MRGRCYWILSGCSCFFLMVSGGTDCVCRARFAGWFYEGAASWILGASSDRLSMAVVWGGLGDGIDIVSGIFLEF